MSVPFDMLEAIWVYIWYFFHRRGVDIEALLATLFWLAVPTALNVIGSRRRWFRILLALTQASLCYYIFDHENEDVQLPTLRFLQRLILYPQLPWLFQWVWTEMSKVDHKIYKDTDEETESESESPDFSVPSAEPLSPTPKLHIGAFPISPVAFRSHDAAPVGNSHILDAALPHDEPATTLAVRNAATQTFYTRLSHDEPAFAHSDAHIPTRWSTKPTFSRSTPRYRDRARKTTEPEFQAGWERSMGFLGRNSRFLQERNDSDGKSGREKELGSLATRQYGRTFAVPDESDDETDSESDEQVMKELRPAILEPAIEVASESNQSAMKELRTAVLQPVIEVASEVDEPAMMELAPAVLEPVTEAASEVEKEPRSKLTWTATDSAEEQAVNDSTERSELPAVILQRPAEAEGKILQAVKFRDLAIFKPNRPSTLAASKTGRLPTSRQVQKKRLEILKQAKTAAHTSGLASQPLVQPSPQEHHDTNRMDGEWTETVELQNRPQIEFHAREPSPQPPQLPQPGPPPPSTGTPAPLQMRRRSPSPLMASVAASVPAVPSAPSQAPPASLPSPLTPSRKLSDPPLPPVPSSARQLGVSTGRKILQPKSMDHIDMFIRQEGLTFPTQPSSQQSAVPTAPVCSPSAAPTPSAPQMRDGGMSTYQGQNGQGGSVAKPYNPGAIKKPTPTQWAKTYLAWESYMKQGGGGVASTGEAELMQWSQTLQPSQPKRHFPSVPYSRTFRAPLQENPKERSPSPPSWQQFLAQRKAEEDSKMETDGGAGGIYAGRARSESDEEEEEGGRGPAAASASSAKRKVVTGVVAKAATPPTKAVEPKNANFHAFMDQKNKDTVMLLGETNKVQHGKLIASVPVNKRSLPACAQALAQMARTDAQCFPYLYRLKWNIDYQWRKKYDFKTELEKWLPGAINQLDKKVNDRLSFELTVLESLPNFPIELPDSFAQLVAMFWYGQLLQIRMDRMGAGAAFRMLNDYWSSEVDQPLEHQQVKVYYEVLGRTLKRQLLDERHLDILRARGLQKHLPHILAHLRKEFVQGKVDWKRPIAGDRSQEECYAERKWQIEIISWIAQMEAWIQENTAGRGVDGDEVPQFAPMPAWADELKFALP